MPKNGFAVAAIIVATNIYASPPAPSITPGGFYLDVGLSRDDIFDAYRETYSNLVTGITNGDPATLVTLVEPSIDWRLDAGAPGWGGLVGLGYTYAWNNNWSLGLEIFGELSSAYGKQHQQKGTNLISGRISTTLEELRMTRSLGLSLFPGYYVAPGALYFFELGYVNSKFEMKGSPILPSRVNFSSLDVPISQPNREVNEPGFRLGFGVNTQVGTHVAVRQEYVWETYCSFSANAQVVGTSLENNTTLITTRVNTSARVSPNAGKYNLAAIYYFAPQTDLTAAPARAGGNFYVGLSSSYNEAYSNTGYASVQNTLVSTLNNETRLDTITSITGFGILKITGFNIGLLAGYGLNFTNRWHAGIELFSNRDEVAGGANVTLTPAVRTTAEGTTVGQGQIINSRLEKEWDFGAAFLPGYQVSEYSLLYARVGYISAQFQNRLYWAGARLQDLTAAETAPLANNNQNSKWINGLQLGVGVDTLVYKNFSLRSEFDINNYGNFNSTFFAITQPARPLTRNVISTVTVATQHRHLIEDQFSLALIWHI